MNFKERSARGLVFLDGAFGTQLQARGLPPGTAPETWNLSHPDEVRDVHAAYRASGADVVYTNTFGANRLKGCADVSGTVAAAVRIAREAAGADGLVALDVGPSGRLLAPAGDCAFEDAYAAFAETVKAGAAAGVDLIAVETFGDTRELKAAVLAAKENADLPVIATVALDASGKLLTGADVDAVATLLEGLRVDALGFNCGLGPDLLLPHVKRLAEITDIPIVVKPNAGLPRYADGKTFFDVDPEAFARGVRALVEAGASLVGGCCGTTPAHLVALRAACADCKPVVRSVSHRCVISGGSHALEIPFDGTVVVGERINPTGKKKLRAALESGDTAYVLREAVAQVEAGAEVLDVNTGVPGLDEPSVLEATVRAVQSVADVPVQIDTSDPIALERAWRSVDGKPLINSVNGKQSSLDGVLPLAARYGGVVVALTLDEKGVPENADGRLLIAKRILQAGKAYGLGPDDFVFDALCLAVSADARAAAVTLETLRRMKTELGVRTCLGVSNVSFGLPDRPALNASFYTLALGAGLSCGIVNPLDAGMMRAVRAYRALTGTDSNCAGWIAQAETGKEHPMTAPVDAGTDPVFAAVKRGLKDDAADACKRKIEDGCDVLEVIRTCVVPALEDVGAGFEKGKVFLPQLLMAADAAAAAFEVLRAHLPAKADGVRRGPLVIATVQGDIHDIGKNICRALLENFGFTVVDLGRDVPPEMVVSAVKKNAPKLVILSALMTTTVPAMEATIKLLRKEFSDVKIAVGGAVLTADCAQRIGADFYTKDAMELVRLCERELV